MQKNITKISSFFIFLISLFLSYFVGEIFYNSIDGTDFYRYFNYIEYFNGSIEATSREQGLFYFWFISNFVEYSHNFYVPDKWEFIYSSAIQLGNFILYIIGLVGLYIWLKSKHISKENILLTFAVLNFFPPIYGGRLIMKPEMLVFCFLPWIFLCIDDYFENKSKLSLFLVSPLLSVLVTSKGTIAMIICTALLYLYYEKINYIKVKDFIFPFIVFFIFSGLLYYENLNINTVSIFNHQELEQYLFTAPISFIYNINLLELVENPFRNAHANSLIGITLIDLFGDYFERYWDHNRSLFFQNRSEIFTLLPNPRRNISLSFSIIFLISTIFFSKDKNFKKFNRVYLIGILVLAATSLGAFGLHFNPDKGDTLKTHYYFYLIAISFTTLLIQYFSKKNYLKNVVSAFLMIGILLFTYGFPKNYDDNYAIKLVDKLPTTVSCNISNKYFESVLNKNINCLNREIAVCGSYENYSTPDEHPDGYLIFNNDDFFTPLNLIDGSGYMVTVNGYAECLHYFNGGYFINNNIYIEDRTPRLNNALMYLSILSMIFITFISIKKKI